MDIAFRLSHPDRGDDCTGSAIPIYSSAQDLQAFRKTNSYRCGLSNAQVAAQLATTPTTPAAHSPAPARRLSLTSTETATVAFTQSFKGTSIVDAHESLHAGMFLFLHQPVEYLSTTSRRYIYRRSCPSC